MSSFLVLRIYLQLHLSSDGDGAARNHFLHDNSVEDKDDNYSVSIFTSMRHGDFYFSGQRHQGGDGVAVMR